MEKECDAFALSSMTNAKMKNTQEQKAKIQKYPHAESGTFFTAQRFVWIRCVAEGIDVQTLSRTEGDGAHIKQGPHFFFPGFSEKNFFESKKLKFFLKTIFFPFPYYVVVSLSHEHAHSTLSRIEQSRQHPKDLVSGDETNTFFTVALWRVIEEAKQHAMRCLSVDNLSILLVENKIISLAVDRRVIDDAGNGPAGKKITADVLHTFVTRQIFSGLSRILPDRGHLARFVQEGFSFSLLHLLAEQEDNAKYARTKSFVTGCVRESETDIFSWDGKTLSYRDSFTFGEKTMYEFFNHSLGVDEYVFTKLLGVFYGAIQTSESVFDSLYHLLTLEALRLHKGMISFKKSLKATKVLVYGGTLHAALKAVPKLNTLLIDTRACVIDKTCAPLNVADDAIFADMCALFSLPVRHALTQRATKAVRWLIPHTIKDIA